MLASSIFTSGALLESEISWRISEMGLKFTCLIIVSSTTYTYDQQLGDGVEEDGAKGGENSSNEGEDLLSPQVRKRLRDRGEGILKEFSKRRI